LKFQAVAHKTDKTLADVFAARCTFSDCRIRMTATSLDKRTNEQTKQRTNNDVNGTAN